MKKIAKSWAFNALLLTSGGFLGVALLAFLSAGEVYDYQDSVDGVHLPKVDAIVVLAGGRGRIAAAGDLWFRYAEPVLALGKVKKELSAADKTIPLLYVSGMGPQANWGVFSRQLRPGVRDLIRPEQVFLETASTNTEENALFFKNNASSHNWKKILLVTSRYHMKRATLIFEKTLIGSVLPIQIETLSIIQDPYEPGEWRTAFTGIKVTMTEYFKWLIYRYTL